MAGLERMSYAMSEPVARPTILLIEDDAAVGTAVEKFLHKIGYDAVLCRTGRAAVEAAETFEPDAIITDIHLPDISGLVLSKTFRDKFGQDMPILVLSGDTSTEVLKTLTHVGATYFLNKPVNFELLKHHLAEKIVPRG
jgi:DNA-binding response OmpR family regulator